SRTVRLERNDEHGRFLAKTMETGHPAKKRHILAGDAEIAAAAPTVAEQRRQYGHDRADGHGEAESLATGNNGGVHADNAAIARDQRPSGVSGIQCGIGLNDLIDQSAGPGPQRSTERADNTRGDGVVKAVWIANRDDELSGAEHPRISERDRHEI